MRTRANVLIFVLIICRIIAIARHDNLSEKQGGTMVSIISSSSFRSKEPSSYLHPPISLKPVSVKTDFSTSHPMSLPAANNQDSMLPHATSLLVYKPSSMRERKDVGMFPMINHYYCMSTALEKEHKQLCSSQEDSSEGSLVRLLTTIISSYLNECDMVILLDHTFKESAILDALLSLPGFKQVALIDSSKSPEELLFWNTPRCQVVIVLLSDPEPMIQLGNYGLFSWDYNARVLIAGLSAADMKTFAHTKKGKKTEHIIGMVEEKQSGHFSIYMNELYWGQRRMIRIAKWTGLSFAKKTILFPDKISNLRKAQLNVAVFEWQPAIFYRRDQDGNVLLRYGRDVDVIIGLTKAFNFTFVYKQTDEKELFGHRLENGSFNGQVGQMHSGEGDLGIANIWLSSLAGRNQFQSYSSTFEVDNSCCMVRVEPPLPLWQSPALPFQMSTWIAFFIGLVLTGPALYVLATVSGKNNPEDPNLVSITSSCLYAYGIHFSQPLTVFPRNSSTQIFVAFLWIYLEVLLTGYNSNLTSFLTIAKQPTAIETFKELYDNGFNFVGIPYMRDSLTFSKDPYLKELVKTYKVEMRFGDIKDYILYNRGVTLNSKTYLELVADIVTATNTKPKFRILKQCLAYYAVGIVYQKHSPLKNKFDLMILRTFESGIVRKWFLDSLKLYYRFKRKDEESKKSTNRKRESIEVAVAKGVIPLNMEHLQGVFILLVCGCLISFILFAVENYM